MTNHSFNENATTPKYVKAANVSTALQNEVAISLAEVIMNGRLDPTDHVDLMLSALKLTVDRVVNGQIDSAGEAFAALRSVGGTRAVGTTAPIALTALAKAAGRESEIVSFDGDVMVDGRRIECKTSVRGPGQGPWHASTFGNTQLRNNAPDKILVTCLNHSAPTSEPTRVSTLVLTRQEVRALKEASNQPRENHFVLTLAINAEGHATSRTALRAHILNKGLTRVRDQGLLGAILA